MFIVGTIQRAYAAGQDKEEENNTVDLLLEDGSVRSVGIYVNDKADVPLLRTGCRVEIVYVLDEMKDQPAPDGGINYAEIALEMAVSLQPTALP